MLHPSIYSRNIERLLTDCALRSFDDAEDRARNGRGGHSEKVFRVSVQFRPSRGQNQGEEIERSGGKVGVELQVSEFQGLHLVAEQPSRPVSTSWLANNVAGRAEEDERRKEIGVLQFGH